MLSQTYGALVAAGAPEDKARAAAEEIAGYEDRLSAIVIDVATIKGDVAAIKIQLSGVATKGDLATIKGDIAAIKAELKGDIAAIKTELGGMATKAWVLGTVLAQTFVLLGGVGRDRQAAALGKVQPA
jgi:hypothetical protein